MTTVVSPLVAARLASQAAGLDGNQLSPLRQHATSVYLLARAGAVVRVSPGSDEPRLSRSLQFIRWLLKRGFPATEPIDVQQPVIQGPYAVTFWRHYPQADRPSPPAGRLGALLRELHGLEPSPLALPNYQPLWSFKEVLHSSTRLNELQQNWLAQRADELLDSYSSLDFPLGSGHIHADAYPGNVLWDGSDVRLGDWDEVASGPRELDLANTFQGVRFGRTKRELDDFAREYGYDVREWNGLTVLCHIRDLHTLGSFIRRTEKGDEAAGRELSYRIATLMTGDAESRWGRA